MSNGGGPSTSSTMANTSASQHHQQQAPSKRDKRRNLLQERLTDLSISFDKDRDLHYRAQLAALQQDLNAIARADTSGRDMRMLDDGAEGIDRIVTGGMYLGQMNADGVISNVRGMGMGHGLIGGIQPGSFYASFVAEVNERMEERDVALTMLHRQYHTKLAALKSQHERNIHHAREEHINLAITMKQRLINRLYNAKKKLSLDKEHLDISDSNALLLHPNQFSLGAGAGGVLGSPGRDAMNGNGGLGDIFSNGNLGSGSAGGGRRKLRQRRNELEDLMMMGPGGIFDNFGSRDRDHNGGNGEGSKSAAQRRKARAARNNRRAGGAGAEDDDTFNDDIYGNMAGGAITPSGSNGNGGVGAAQLASLLQKQQNGQNQASGSGSSAGGVNTAAAQAQELLTKPVWSIEKLFTEKELQMAGNLAALATVKYFSAPQEKRGTGGKKIRKDGTAEEDGDIGGTDDNTDGTRTPREGGTTDAPAGNGNAATTASDDPFQSKHKDKESTNATTATPSGSKDAPAIPDLSNQPLPPNPATLFSHMLAVSATNHHNTRSAAALLNNIPQTQTPLINSTTLAHQPPPNLATLNFMTPSAAGYGAASWQQLGVPASYFSAGSGSVINSSRTVTLSAPAPAPARSEEATEDLEMIKRGVEVTFTEGEMVGVLGGYMEDEEDDEGDEAEEEREEVIRGSRRGGKGKAPAGSSGSAVTTSVVQDVEMQDANTQETTNPPPPLPHEDTQATQDDPTMLVGLGVTGAGIALFTPPPSNDTQEQGDDTQPDTEAEAPAPVDPAAVVADLPPPPPSASASTTATSTSHGVKRRASSGAGGVEKRVRKGTTSAVAGAGAVEGEGKEGGEGKEKEKAEK